jgi:hypothetical protein
MSTLDWMWTKTMAFKAKVQWMLISF